MRRIEQLSDLEEGLAFLGEADRRLKPVIALAGPVPLRRRAGGFEGLAATITAQQISDAAADAIWGRLSGLARPFTSEAFLGLGDEELKGAGLSRGKIRTLRGVAEACANGLDLESLADRPADSAIAELVQISGIGPWTAEVYLLFSAGHADVFPAGDLALQQAAMDAFALAERPGDKALREIAAPWSPWRSVAARLLWAYYRARRESRRAEVSARPRPTRGSSASAG